MILVPVPIGLIVSSDDIEIALSRADLRSGDIVAVSSKVVAISEGAAIDLRNLKPSAEAQELSLETGRSPQFMEAVLEETKRLHGKTIGSSPGAVLTEVRPDGLDGGSILTANAGLDESNVQEGWAVGWPHHPIAWLKKMRSKHTIGFLITDSCCHPRRRGVTAFALAVAGFDPVQSLLGRKDLHGKELKITTEAVADQLATAANRLMGNAGESIPAVIIRDHGIPPSDFCGWVLGMSQEEDLFRGIL